MKKMLFAALALALFAAACSPKTGNKTTSTPTSPTPTASAPSKAPQIPLPTGDVRKSAPQAGTPPKIQIGKAETFTLENGLKVILVENHKLPKASFRVFVDSDPVLQKEATGYVEMMGELLTKGTKTRTKAQIDEEIDYLGASLYSDENGVSGDCLSKHSEKLLTILSDVLLNPAFPQEELEKAKRRQESNLASAKDDPNSISRNVASVLRYGKDHPYGEIMTEASLAKVNLDQIKGHYNTFFKPNTSYLVVVGDVTKAQAERYANQYFGKWQKGNVPELSYPAPRAPEKNQVNFVHKPGAVQSVISISYPLEFKPGPPDAIPARLLNSILGGGSTSSRLNGNLRETHGWTYGAYSSLNSDKLVGSFSAQASVRNAVSDSAVIEFFKEMNRMRTEKVSAEDLQTWKNFVAGQFSQSLEEPGTVANFALSTARFGLPADYYEKYLEVLQGASAEQLMALAKKYIRPDNAHIVVVGNRDDVAERLKQFGEAGKINFYDAFGNPLRQNNASVPQGMTAEKVVEDYVNAIGGTAKIATIKDLQSTATMKTRGPEFSIKTWQKGGSKIAIEMAMGTQVVSKQIFDGEKGAQIAMGQTELLEGKELADIRDQAAICKEAEYAKNGCKLTLKGIEELNGSNAYVVEVERPDGKKSTDYYDMKTSLKVREVSPGMGADGQPSVQTIEVADYKAVGGVLIPHTLTVSGVFPVPFKIVIGETQVNAGVDDAVFKF
jgi:zinc protease